MTNEQKIKALEGRKQILLGRTTENKNIISKIDREIRLLKKMMRQLDKVLLNAELVRYLVVGALTTLINYLCFLFSTAVIHMPWTYANIAAWIISVVFAFVTNRKLVFNSKGSWKKECISFFFLRFISLLAEFLFCI